MRSRTGIGLAFVLGLAVAAGACGDDNPSLAGDGSSADGSGSGSGMDGSGAATFTSFVIDLVKNHSGDANPAAFTSFSTLPDPDGDANNVHAYDSLF